MKVLAAHDAEKLLSTYVNVSKNILSSDVDQAILFAKYPAVLKIISQQALHKTEIKGVRIVHNKEDLMQNYADLLKSALKHNIILDGILVQKFEEGTEIFIGIKKDETFGHVIGLGLGGIYVEQLKDVQWRKCPITEKDADSMIEHLKMKDVIKGVRNEHNNVNDLKKTLITVSHIPKRYPDLKEMDINPLILKDKATVVDARMVFE